VIGAAVVAQFHNEIGALVAAPFLAHFSRHFQHFGFLAANFVASNASKFRPRNWKNKQIKLLKFNSSSTRNSI
jgi:hypothetical protein